MSRKTTSRNVNNAIYGQPRGSIGARACRPLQLCLPLPLSVRPFLSLSLCLPLPESSFVRVFLLPLTFYKLFVLFRVAALSYYVRRAQYLLLPQVKFTCKGNKKKTTPWSVISVTQSPRSMKIMMNVRGKTVSYLLGFEIWNLPAGMLRHVFFLLFFCCFCFCFLLYYQTLTNGRKLCYSIQPWHGPGCLQEKEAWGKCSSISLPFAVCCQIL